jgi:hypothetical protein
MPAICEDTRAPWALHMLKGGARNQEFADILALLVFNCDVETLKVVNVVDKPVGSSR